MSIQSIAGQLNNFVQPQNLLPSLPGSAIQKMLQQSLLGPQLSGDVAGICNCSNEITSRNPIQTLGEIINQFLAAASQLVNLAVELLGGKNTNRSSADNLGLGFGYPLNELYNGANSTETSNEIMGLSQSPLTMFSLGSGPLAMLKGLI